MAIEIKHEQSVSTKIYMAEVQIQFFFFFIDFFFFDLGFMALSRIFHLYWDDRSSSGLKLENLGKKHLTIHKQNLAFPHVTTARLEPQRWETYWIKSQLSYPLGYGVHLIEV